MKKIAILIFLAGNFLYAQNFFENESAEDYSVKKQNAPMFEKQADIPADPEYGVDSAPNPNPEVPIDKNWYFLLIAGLALGFYFLYKVPKEKTV